MQEATYHELARIEHATKARVYAKHGMHGKAESHKLRAAHHASFGKARSPNANTQRHAFHNIPDMQNPGWNEEEAEHEEAHSMLDLLADRAKAQRKKDEGNTKQHAFHSISDMQNPGWNEEEEEHEEAHSMLHLLADRAQADRAEAQRKKDEGAMKTLQREEAQGLLDLLADRAQVHREEDVCKHNRKKDKCRECKGPITCVWRYDADKRGVCRAAEKHEEATECDHGHCRYNSERGQCEARKFSDTARACSYLPSRNGKSRGRCRLHVNNKTIEDVEGRCYYDHTSQRCNLNVRNHPRTCTWIETGKRGKCRLTKPLEASKPADKKCYYATTTGRCNLTKDPKAPAKSDGARTINSDRRLDEIFTDPPLQASTPGRKKLRGGKKDYEDDA
jgi:hypothetical protein